MKLYKTQKLLHLEDSYLKSLVILWKSIITTQKTDASIQYSEFQDLKIQKSVSKLNKKNQLLYISMVYLIVVRE